MGKVGGGGIGDPCFAVQSRFFKRLGSGRDGGGKRSCEPVFPPNNVSHLDGMVAAHDSHREGWGGRGGFDPCFLVQSIFCSTPWFWQRWCEKQVM